MEDRPRIAHEAQSAKALVATRARAGAQRDWPTQLVRCNPWPARDQYALYVL